MEVHLLTLFSRLAQAENWTKTKDFHLSYDFTFYLAFRMGHTDQSVLPQVLARQNSDI